MEEMNLSTHANGLAGERSLYLRQHARQPIHWQPWNERSLRAAQAADRPLFVSIGYAACHWCHVMAREAFEDAGVAALLNERFLCIKIDREERPDLDSLYMDICVRETGQGGWPLSVFLLPDQRPFYIGTYFPARSLPGRPGLLEVARSLSDLYRDDRSRLERAADALLAPLKEEGKSERPPSALPIAEQAFREMAAAYDPEFGGFGDEPKFPAAPQLAFLLRFGAGQRRPEAFEIALQTLVHIASGSLRDHVGGGFHRYAVARDWGHPHFEKMLYDQALLLELYAEAYQLTGRAFFRAVGEETASFCLRELRGPRGLFYTSLDADSEGREGAYYTWSTSELQRVLGADAALFHEAYGAQAQSGQPFALGRQRADEKRLANAHRLSEEQVTAALSEHLGKLFAARQQRLRPARDEKILVSWNAHAIAALAKSAGAFGNRAHLNAAQRAAVALLAAAAAEEQQVLASADGAERPAFLDDVAGLLKAMNALFLASGEGRWLREAERFASVLERQFLDPVAGGFYFTAGKVSAPLGRQKRFEDTALPAGNAVAAQELHRLWKLTGREKWAQLASRTAAACDMRTKSAFSHAALIQAQLEIEAEGSEWVLTGSDRQAVEGGLASLRSRFLPFDVWAPALGAQGESALAEGRFRADQPFLCWRCRGFACSAPQDELPF